jgi:hypothetical protein
MTIRVGLVAIASVAVLACASPAVTPPATSAPLQLRFLMDERSCPAAAVPLPLTFRINVAADEDIVAVAANGATLHVSWSREFHGGTALEPVVRDSSGQVVARDGEVIETMTLHGHPVCAGSDEIYVLA